MQRRDPLRQPFGDQDLICAVSVAIRICGTEVACKLIKDFAGTRICIPRGVRPDHPLAKSLGHANAVALSAEIGGTLSYIPMSLSARGSRRRALVQHMVGEGVTIAAIARATGHSERAISRDVALLRQAGVRIDPLRNQKRKSVK